MIYYCFMFNDEYDLLEVQLNTMNSIVDKFVISEGPYTQSGEKKPLYFELVKNDLRFRKFKDKIIHIIDNGLLPKDKLPEGKRSRWYNENHQRNAIQQVKFKSNDLIISGDVDEIMNPDVLPILKKEQKPVTLMQHLYYYYLNCQSLSSWRAVISMRGKHLKNKALSDMRLERNNFKAINNAGWHFSYLGGVERVIKKLKIMAHAEYSTEKYWNKENVEKCLREGKDLFGRKLNKYKFVEKLNVPKYILENMDKFKKYVKEL